MKSITARLVAICTLTAAAWCIGSAVLAEDAKPPKPTGSPLMDSVNGLPRHRATYDDLTLPWHGDRGVPDALAVFPHTVLPQRVIVATDKGLMLSDDYGTKFAALPEGSRDKLGLVRHIEFNPIQPDTFLVATDKKGIWATADNGKSFKQLATAAAGLASDTVAEVHYHAGDITQQTLVAIHGPAARGISLSYDGGQTWDVRAKDYNVNMILLGGPGECHAYMSGSHKDNPDVRCIYFAYWVGDFWSEIVRDVMPSGCARSVMRGDSYWATTDSGVYRVGSAGATKLNERGPTNYVSIGTVWGPDADTELLYLYQPSQVGMFGTMDGFKSTLVYNQGLYVGNMLREGAHIRANANGTVFYSAANGVFCIAQARYDQPRVTDVQVSPACLIVQDTAFEKNTAGLRGELASFVLQDRAAVRAPQLLKQFQELSQSSQASRITITARVKPPMDTPVSKKMMKLKAVTVDLSRLGGSPRQPMLDNGATGDGAANDGVYGAICHISPATLRRHDGDWRRHYPGPLALTVSAVWEDDSVSAEVGVVSLFNLPQTFTYWSESEQKWWIESSNIQNAGNDNASPHGGQIAQKLSVNAGKWSATFGYIWGIHNVMSHYAVSFYVKADREDTGELFFALRDTPYDTVPNVSPAVAVCKGGYIAGGTVTKEYKRVVIPLRQFVKGASRLQLNTVGGVVFSGDAASARSYWIDDIRFYATAEELAAEEKAAAAAGGK